MAESFEMSAFFPGITDEHLYRAWLDGEEHAAMTGSPARAEPRAGGISLPGMVIFTASHWNCSHST